ERSDPVLLLHAPAVIDDQHDRRGDDLGGPGRLEIKDLDVLAILGDAEVRARGIEQERPVWLADLELDGDSGKLLLAGTRHHDRAVARVAGRLGPRDLSLRGDHGSR